MSSQHEYGLVPLSSENLLPWQGPYDRRASQGGMPFDYDTAYTGQSSQSSFHYESHANVPTSADRKYVNSYSVPVTHQGYRDLPYNPPPGRGAKEHADAVRNSQLSRRTSMIWDLVVDLLLVIPALAFLLYAAAATHYDGRPLTEKGWHAVATLYDISVYTPTIFPIVFAAIAANLLKSVAAWKLERGISVLSLEYLLRSRTVFSAVTSPVILKSANALTPLVITFWALSPLGGQAALRVLNTTPNGHKQPWNCSYLELRPEVPPIFGVEDYAVNSTVIATFAAALASPADSKEAKQDIFTNVKIPMIEPYLFSTEGDQGWYKLRDDKDPFYAYSSLVGLPLKPQESFIPAFNYSVRLNTSYISANCTANNRTMDIDGWWDYVDQHRDFSNGKGLIIETSNHTSSSAKPRLIQVTSYQPGELTNVFCGMSTSFVEVEIECHHSQCGAVRIRWTPGMRTNNSTPLDDMKRLASQKSRPDHAFLQQFLNLTEPRRNGTFFLPSPMELYLFGSDEPYANAPTWDNAWNSGSREDWERGARVFPKRLTQLLNTFWIASLTPLGAAQFSKFSDPAAKHRTAPVGRTTTGYKMSDERVLSVNKAWLAVLFVASFTMLFAALAAAALGVLRRGPDILDYSTTMIRDNPYASTSTGQRSMEDGAERTHRLRHVRLCIGDVMPQGEEGYVALATVDKAVPLGKQRKDRRYL